MILQRYLFCHAKYQLQAVLSLSVSLSLPFLHRRLWGEVIAADYTDHVRLWVYLIAYTSQRCFLFAEPDYCVLCVLWCRSKRRCYCALHQLHDCIALAHIWFRCEPFASTSCHDTNAMGGHFFFLIFRITLLSFICLRSLYISLNSFSVFFIFCARKQWQTPNFTGFFLGNHSYLCEWEKTIFFVFFRFFSTSC